MNSVKTKKKSFKVIKQQDGKGPFYLVEVCAISLKVINKKLITEISEEMSANEFYSLIDEGSRLDIIL